MNASNTSKQAVRPLRTWRFPRLLVEDHLALMLMAWGGLVATVAAIVIGIAWFGTVTGSAWEMAAGFAPFFVAFMSGYVLYSMLPLHVAHGRTRRDFAIEAAIFGGIYAVVGAVLITVGYILERAFYAIGGWPLGSSGFGEQHLFASHTELPMIFAEYLLVLVVWAAAGAFVGAAIYRYEGGGYLALLPASILVSLVGTFTSGYWGPLGFLMERLTVFDTPSLPLAVVIAAACVVAGCAMAWRVVRDVPLHSR